MSSDNRPPLSLNGDIDTLSNGDVARLLSMLLNAIPLKIFWKDRELNFGGCNDLFCLDAGVETPNEIVGLSDYDLPWTKTEADFFRSCDRSIIDEDEAQIGIIESQTSASGDLSWVETSKIPLRDEQGMVHGILGIYHDVTNLKKNEQALQQSHAQLEQSHDELEVRVLERTRELQHLAQHDCLTDLVNREQFLRRLDDVLAEDNTEFALLFIDLDRFKTINDSLGHSAGDQLLVQVSQILQDSVRPNDIVGRFGGDEFTVLLKNVRNRQEVIAVSDRIQSTLHKSIVIEKCPLVVSASIGIVVDSSTNYESAGHVLRDADIAMYEAKEHGKARHQIFTDQMYERAKDRLLLENEMRAGLRNGEFFLEFQPVCDIRNQTLTGFEALARWRHPTRGIVHPEGFIAIAEETGMIKQLGEHVLHQACETLAQWRDSYPELSSDLSINVNLSAVQLACPKFPEVLRSIVDHYGLFPSDIKIEITENLLLADHESMLTLFSDLREQGFKLLLDDFGTGFCSLSYLHRFPIDTLKIDRSFIQSMNSDQQSKAIVKTILALAEILDLKVVAEGVETKWQEQTLKEMGCDFAQGYLYSRPIHTDETASYIVHASEHWQYADCESNEVPANLSLNPPR